MGLRNPQSWYSRIENYLHSLGLSKSEDDPNLYINAMKNKTLILVLYIDEFFLTVEKHLIAWCKRELTYEFEDLSLMHYLLESFSKEISVFFFLQRKNTIDVSRKFGMMYYKSIVYSFKKLQ